MKIKQYTILKSETPEVLSKRVNDAIERGWQPFGGIAVVAPNDGSMSQRYWYVQAMVVYE